MTMINKGISLGIGVVSLAVAVALAGCNGGGASTASNNSITGMLTGFGSVYVNGVEYDTSSTSYSVDGAPGFQ